MRSVLKRGEHDFGVRFMIIKDETILTSRYTKRVFGTESNRFIAMKSIADILGYDL